MITTRAWCQLRLQSVIFLLLASWVAALDISYCSPDNAGGSNSVNSIYMSNGNCQTNCKSAYVFAVIQGQNCWCSNYAPSNQVNTGECSDPCPGFPSEKCGNQGKNLYAYFNLGGDPSGTFGGSAPTSRPSSSIDQSSSSSSSSSRVTSAPSVITSVISITGKASTVLITQSPAQTSDSALGQASQNQQGGGLKAGAVAGIVIGVAIVIGAIIGVGIFYWIRRRNQRSNSPTAESFVASTGGKGTGGIPSRQVSQMSSAGLLTRPTRTQTGGYSEQTGGGTLNSDRNSTHMTVDQRLNPWAIYSNEVSRASNVSLQDNQDYSRQLRVANPDP